MKITRKNRKWIIGGAALLLTATPSFALFGIGDIVFDPTSYASLVSQLTTLETQYNMLKNNIEHFSFKQQWQTTLNTMKNANVRNMFGETNGMTHRAQHQLAGGILDGVDGRHGAGERHDHHLPGRADAGQHTAFGARHGRSIGLGFARLPYRRRPVPGSKDAECDGQQQPCLRTA